MNLATVLTASRIYLSPAFFVVFSLPEWVGLNRAVAVAVLWVIFAAIEISDVVDGSVARAFGQVTDTGKLLDPFADVFSRLTYFVCFLSVGIMQTWVFILILYREFGIVFVRMMMYRHGVALAAKAGGKIKAVMYAVAGILGLGLHTVRETGFLNAFEAPLSFASRFFFAAAAALALVSFFDYLHVFARSRRS